MKFLQFTDSDVFAGTERHIHELAVSLHELGHGVEVACPPQGVLGKMLTTDGIGVYPIEKNGGLDYRAVWQLVKGLRERRFDLVHTHNGRTAFLAALSILLAGRGSLVTTQHFLEPAHTHLSGAKAWAFRSLHRWIARRTARIVAISEAVRESLEARGGIDPQKICVVPNGISDPLLDHSFSRQTVRDALGVAEETPLVATTARLVAEKGLDVLVRAMRLVISKAPQARCIIAGEGKLRGELETLITKEGVGQAVALLGFRADVLPLVAACDVFVLASPNEPFGLSLLEAMALGKPVIATRAGGPKDIVEDGQSGLLVAPNDSVAMATAIGDLLASPDKMAELGKRARERFLAHFHARQMAEKMTALYRQSLPEDVSVCPGMTAGQD